MPIPDFALLSFLLLQQGGWFPLELPEVLPGSHHGLSKPNLLPRTSDWRDAGSFVPGRDFSPGGLEAGMGISPGAKTPHAEVILIYIDGYSVFPSLLRTRPMPSTAMAETKVILG